MTATGDVQPTAVAADRGAKATIILDDGQTNAAQLAHSEEKDTADHDDGLLDDGDELCTQLQPTNEHKRWYGERDADGWTVGKDRDEKLKTNPTWWSGSSCRLTSPIGIASS